MQIELIFAAFISLQILPAILKLNEWKKKGPLVIDLIHIKWRSKNYSAIKSPFQNPFLLLQDGKRAMAIG